MTRKLKLAAATLAALFCIAATAAPATAERFGSCEIHDAKAKKHSKKAKGKHKGDKGVGNNR